MQVLDPTLFVFAFFDRHLPPRGEPDPREQFRWLFSSFDARYRLRESDPDCRVGSVTDLSLKDVGTAGDRFVQWLGRAREGPRAQLREAMAYSFGDTLYLHAMESRGGWATDLATAWCRLSIPPRSILQACDWKAARRGLWGLNVCLSVLVEPVAYERFVAARAQAIAGGCSHTPAVVAETVLGQLWLVSSDWMALTGVPADLTATWIMVSPTSAEDELQSRLHSFHGTPQAPVPPPVPLLFQSRQKFLVQLRRYERSRGDLQATETSLDDRMDRLIEAQRDLEEPSQIIDSAEAEELRQKTARTHTNLASFEKAVSRVHDVLSTLRINHRNHQEDRQRLLLPDGEDQIFGPEGEYMDRRIKQIEYDATYFGEALQRARATLESAQSRFNIAAERASAHGVRHGITQVSGLFASLIALALIEILGFSDFPLRRPLLTANFIALTLLGSFAVTQLLLSWRHVHTKLIRWSLALAAGAAATTLLAIPTDRRWWLWFAAPAFLVAAAVTYAVVRYREERPRLEHVPAWRRRVEFKTEIDKLREANEELADLLDDLPPSTDYRLKKDASFLEKIERKRAKQLEEAGHATFTEFNVGDPIGIRYVVSPWELPLVVERVKRALGRKLAKDPEYKAGRYKSVHLDVDLWGPGAQNELMAEIQVRTRWQHFYADSVHDVLYKDVPGGGVWFLRALKRTPLTRWTLPFWDWLLSLPSGLEMFLFRRWMRWPRPPKARGGR